MFLVTCIPLITLSYSNLLIFTPLHPESHGLQAANESNESRVGCNGVYLEKAKKKRPMGYYKVGEY